MVQESEEELRSLAEQAVRGGIDKKQDRVQRARNEFGTDHIPYHWVAYECSTFAPHDMGFARHSR